MPGASFSQRVGSLKIPGKVVGEEIKLQKVHVLLKVKDRKATCELCLSTAQVLIREIKENREPKKKGVERPPQVHNGDISFNTLLKVAMKLKDDPDQSV